MTTIKRLVSRPALQLQDGCQPHLPVFYKLWLFALQNVPRLFLAWASSFKISARLSLAQMNRAIPGMYAYLPAAPVYLSLNPR